MQLRFTKMHGLGNDFIVIDDLEAMVDLPPETIRYLCDRHIGVGADGLILIRPGAGPEADYSMVYYNADGTVAEMCGNGIRCFAARVADLGLIKPDSKSVRVRTLGGVRPIMLTRAPGGDVISTTVDMGAPILDPARIPIDSSLEPVIDFPIETELGVFTVTAVSMGNPHAVLWVDNVASAPVCSVGPLVELHPAFPARTNVEFAQVMSDEHIRIRVWERGVGETLACGTGACATLVAGVLSRRTAREATISLLGGDLSIRWDTNGSVFMTGPAATVFEGTVRLPTGS